MFEIENTCDKYKLFIPAENYTTPQHLAWEMQLSTDALENGFLRQADANSHISYNETNNRINVVAQNENDVRLLFRKAFGE